MDSCKGGWFLGVRRVSTGGVIIVKVRVGMMILTDFGHDNPKHQPLEGANTCDPKTFELFAAEVSNSRQVGGDRKS